MENTQPEGGENNRDLEVAPALISVHPTQDSVAVAVGSDLRVFDLRGNCAVTLVDETGEAFHKDSIRAIRYGANGKLFVSSGDDKLVKVWSTDSWRCNASVCSEKRVSAVAVSNDGLYVCYADKFGVVWVVDLHGLDGNETLVNKKASPLLAHYCSIITSLEFSPDGRFIVTADRDFKIRVTVFPKKPLDGAHEIQSFCLGHTEFVSCLAFLFTVDYPQGFLVSGGGDSTVRLWDINPGTLLDTYEFGSKAGIVDYKGNEVSCSTVTDLCTIPGSNVVAVAVQSLQGILLVSCDLSSQTFGAVKVISNMGDSFIPTSLGCSSSVELLWTITGVSKPHGSNHNSLTCVRVLSGFKKTIPDAALPELTVVDDNEVPGAEKLLEKLQGSVTVEEEVFLAAAEAVKTSMCNLLIKKQYTTEKREFRKRGRNDKKTKH
ncbi:WD40 REPEAT PROTEIN 4 [Salix koriyanagi]|uniref:tRNA (guanine-N(7)-)-methyltransferase non-catalytic subunit n=1 Tax=Salix koriyanagi TaxID=2511006 RepID=A0A9Q0SL27_9ROSI|nr:WD40 REPEAT PROTEIN 4 [Salix koriyanagi]